MARATCVKKAEGLFEVEGGFVATQDTGGRPHNMKGQWLLREEVDGDIIEAFEGLVALLDYVGEGSKSKPSNVRTKKRSSKKDTEESEDSDGSDPGDENDYTGEGDE